GSSPPGTEFDTPGIVDEVQTFLSLVAEERIQRELDGATRNEKVFQEVAQLLAAHGYHRTYKQCRDKLKKLKSDYRAIKDHNGRSGANRRTWKWFDQIDASTSQLVIAVSPPARPSTPATSSRTPERVVPGMKYSGGLN
uniref:Myb/SANT-like DNA-binding domain-containing protein n=1 Tax=Cyprinus carpio TaxID=7962 RepID=A0A8C1S3F3_CYPCA